MSLTAAIGSRDVVCVWEKDSRAGGRSEAPKICQRSHTPHASLVSINSEGSAFLPEGKNVDPLKIGAARAHRAVRRKKHMENAVKARLQSVQFGDPQAHKGVTIVPLLALNDGKFQYNCLGQAIASGDLVITEVSNAGSVPELLVTNKGSTPVLLIDGEEVAGAKQNRVLNTSILLKESSETKIPVSCTEQGRWSYSSKVFSDSGHIMAHKSRFRKSSSVHASLEASGKYQSDQGEVWAEIAELQVKAGTQSPTSAMHDIFKAREEDLRKSEEIFKPVTNQIGLLAFIGRDLAGMDLVSQKSAYARLHPKLVRSYILGGLIEANQQVLSQEDITRTAKDFLCEIMATEPREFPSIGHGTDYRFKGHNLAGMALVHENEVIHTALFCLDERHSNNHMAALRQRRRHFS